MRSSRTGSQPRLLECDEEISRLIDQQSQELDPAKRLALVQVIQRKLELESTFS